MLPGLYSLQAVPSDPKGADVTIYRRDVKDALSWKGTMIKRGGYDKFLLRHAVDAWEVYDSDGKLVCKSSDVTGAGASEPRRKLEVNRELVEIEAMAAVGPGLTCLSCVEGHAGASAAEHSNFCVFGRKLLMDAKPEDLTHVFIVESKAWPCRVMSMFADMSRVSEEFQNKFLDRHHWWSKGWALDNEHHKALLATRLSDGRRDYLNHVFVEALLESGAAVTGDDALDAKVSIALASVDTRRTMASRLIHLLYADVVYGGRTEAEAFSEAALKKHAAAIAQTFRETL